ncbi:MAG: Tellurite resistance protein TerB [Thermoleophilia bacterium]|nr:Tellurite resistance protein TerB [Thermoleophilia bacterium]
MLQHLLGRSHAARDFAQAALQLRLLVAMAAADERISPPETVQIADFLDRVSRTDRDHRRLHNLFDQLLIAPPTIDSVLEDLAQSESSMTCATALVHELADVAFADSAIDHREDFLLELVCSVLGLEAPSLYEPLDFSDGDISLVHGFAHRLADVSRAA